jgi:hypothetical protein
MSRFFLAMTASAALAASACVSSSHNTTCDARTVAIGWSSFLDATGNITSSCGTLGLASVDVFMDDAPVGTFDCTTGGVNVTQVTNQSHLFTVEGLDSSGNIIVRDEVTVDPSNCRNLVVDTRPAEGYADLEYDFYSGSTPVSQDVCYNASSHLWFKVTDTIANVTSYLFTGANAGSAPLCESSQRTQRLLLPAGTFTLNWMEEHDYANSQALTAADCTPHNFSVDRGKTDLYQNLVKLDVTAVAACH